MGRASHGQLGFTRGPYNRCRSSVPEFGASVPEFAEKETHEDVVVRDDDGARDDGLLAQPPAADSGYTASVRNRWNAIKRNISGSAQAMPDAGFAFKPTPEVRSFGELLGHLTNEHYIFCSQMKGEKNPHEAVDFEKKTTKAEFVKDINDSIAYCDAAYAAIKDDAKTITPSHPTGAIRRSARC